MKNFRWILAVLLLIILLIRVTSHRHSSGYDLDNNSNGKPIFSRNADHLIFTKHARCRMQCRDITPAEVNEILHNGSINYDKSELNDKGGPKYALEGYSNEHQHLRIIFAPENDGMVVITTIDLDKDWPCQCE